MNLLTMGWLRKNVFLRIDIKEQRHIPVNSVEMHTVYCMSSNRRSRGTAIPQSICSHEDPSGLRLAPPQFSPNVPDLAHSPTKVLCIPLDVGKVINKRYCTQKNNDPG